MAIFEIETDITAIENNASLYKEKNFEKRIEAIDFLEFHVFDLPEELIQLKNRAEKLKSTLEDIDAKLFQKLRKNISTGGYTRTAFKNMVKEYVAFNLDDVAHMEEPGYDNLDIFINGLFPFQTMPEPTKDLEPEMVFYQKTPARVVFELVEKARLTNDDIFFDLGSGLGQAAILVNLLTGITAKGIEFEPAFCDYANDCAAQLNLSKVTFINADARKSDYTEGTVFFMYTPFKGEIMEEVLAALHKEALSRRIKVITYGPCTPQVVLQSWLHCEVPANGNIYKPAVFTSF
jgi:hypothetical protein